MLSAQNVFAKCFVNSCKSTSWNTPQKSLYRFPKKSKTFICSEHFPNNLLGKQKIKESSYVIIENILTEQGIIIPTNATSSTNLNKKTLVSRKCILKHCTQTNLSIPRVKFFSFPNCNSDLYKIWCEKCKLSEVDKSKKSKVICEKHFDSYSIKKKLTKKNAIPNCSLPVDEIIIKCKTPKPNVYDFNENTSEIEKNVFASNPSLSNHCGQKLTTVS